ncbi:MAG TPA: amino acid ABC transporter permease [Reyranella sp.]|nr:amino acid ABC transporter permease [Reyranella sp.]
MTGLIEFLPAVGQGLLTTASIAVLSIVGCALVAIVLGVARRSRNQVVKLAAGSIVELLRGASVLIYLFWVYYALPLVPGLPHFSPLVVSIVVLSLVGGAYGAEIVVSGLQAVPRGQAEASQALGLSKFLTLTRIVLPQALTQIVPAFASLAIDMVKWTSVVSFVGVQDLLSVANTIRTITYSTVGVYVGVALLYFLLCLLTSWFFQRIEHSLPLNRALRAASTPDARSCPATLVLKSQGSPP